MFGKQEVSSVDIFKYLLNLDEKILKIRNDECILMKKIDILNKIYSSIGDDIILPFNKKEFDVFLDKTDLVFKLFNDKSLEVLEKNKLLLEENEVLKEEIKNTRFYFDNLLSVSDKKIVKQKNQINYLTYKLINARKELNEYKLRLTELINKYK